MQGHHQQPRQRPKRNEWNYGIPVLLILAFFALRVAMRWDPPGNRDSYELPSELERAIEEDTERRLQEAYREIQETDKDLRRSRGRMEDFKRQEQQQAHEEFRRFMEQVRKDRKRE